MSPPLFFKWDAFRGTHTHTPKAKKNVPLLGHFFHIHTKMSENVPLLSVPAYGIKRVHRCYNNRV